MEKYYYYRVEAKLVEEQEEKMLVENIKNSDLFYCRADAFDFFDDIINKYLIQFKGSFSLLEPYIKIILIKNFSGFDFEDGFRVDTKREETYPLYILSGGLLNRIDKSFEFEIEVLKEKNVVIDSFPISDLYEFTAEKTFICRLKNELGNQTLLEESDRTKEYIIIECCKCRKKMEVLKKLNNFRPWEIKVACKTCIKDFYLKALDSISYRIYDKSGIPINKSSPKLY